MQQRGEGRVAAVGELPAITNPRPRGVYLVHCGLAP
jgi:hypothetical protein